MVDQLVNAYDSVCVWNHRKDLSSHSIGYNGIYQTTKLVQNKFILGPAKVGQPYKFYLNLDYFFLNCNVCVYV